MSTADPITDSARGYLSQESKRRFTLVAGLLGAAFFFAQIALPFLALFLFMMPMVGRTISTTDVSQAVLWRDALWLVENAVQPNWRAPGRAVTKRALERVELADLSSRDPMVPLDSIGNEAGLSLLPIGERLWVIGTETVGFYENGSLTQLRGKGRTAGASKPFAYEGRPAVIRLGARPALATLQASGGSSEWTARELSLGLRPEAGSLRSLQAVETNGRLYLFAEVCTEEPEQCTLSYRALEDEEWSPLSESACSCMSWVALGGPRPSVVAAKPDEDGANNFLLITILESGPARRPIELETKHSAWRRWHALSQAGRLYLVSEDMPGGLTLAEVEDGRVVRLRSRKGSFPFGPDMMLVMMLPHALPVLLSLGLALLLTTLMRRHRVQEYVFEGSRRQFASLWRRALAQLVDALVLGAAFVAPLAWMWRMFSDPVQFVESGPEFMLWFFGLFVAAFAWGALALVAFSYFEGRSGKTPGKWLLRIRVLGTDLRPCGFGRALLRNLLTFVDGFFSFLVGALLVALTENWQRLGDLAARTIVVADDRPA